MSKMSIWDNLKKLAQPYDDEYDGYEEEDDLEGFVEEEEAPAERPARTRRPSPFSFSADKEESDYTAPAAAPSSSVSGFSGNVVSLGGKQEVVLFHPASFNDTSTAADHLRSKKAVIVNMENVDKAVTRRVVDFLSGCAYALDGTVNKIALATYLFCPHNMEVMGDLESLQSEAESYV